MTGARKFSTMPGRSAPFEQSGDDSLSDLQSFNVRRRPSRNTAHYMNRSSVVSMGTEDELHAVAELLSPSVTAFDHRRNLSMSTTLADSEDHYSESHLLRPEVEEIEEQEMEEEKCALQQREVDPVRALYESTQNYMEPESPGVASSSDDDYLFGSTRQQLQVPPSSGFHLPRRQRPTSLTAPYNDSYSNYSDTPSLVSSYDSITQSPASSVRTPSITSSPLQNELSGLRSVPERHALSSGWDMDEGDGDDDDDDLMREEALLREDDHMARRSTPSQERFSRQATHPKTINSGWSISPKIVSATLSSPMAMTIPPSIMLPVRTTPTPPRPRTAPTRLNSTTPPRIDTRNFTQSPSPNSHSSSNDPSPSKRAARGISKLLSPTKSNTTPSVSSANWATYSASPSSASLQSSFLIDSKSAKAEGKRRKKEDAKARTAELAERMRDTRKLAAQKAESASQNSRERGRKKEPGVMFGGFVL